MKYAESMQRIDTEKGLTYLGLKFKKNGSYLYFPCPKCGNDAAIKFYGEKKNVSYCPACRTGNNIIALAVKLKGIDFQEAKNLLLDKTTTPKKPIAGELHLTYALEWCDLMEKEGVNKELCQTIGVGKPKGKTMLSGCIAFTVHNEKGVKIAYYGIRIADRHPMHHKSFNPQVVPLCLSRR